MVYSLLFFGSRSANIRLNATAMYIIVDIPREIYFQPFEHGCEINHMKNNTIKKNNNTKVPTPIPKTNESGLDIVAEVGLAVGVITRSL